MPHLNISTFMINRFDYSAVDHDCNACVVMNLTPDLTFVDQTKFALKIQNIENTSEVG